jgi:hypothetical protein
MDVAQKKQELLERLAEAPAGVVFARIDILNEVQLADLMKAEFVPYLRGAANTTHSNSDSLHEVCTNLAKQRALLQGAAVGDVLSFDIDDGTSVTRAAGTSPHNATGSFSYPKFEDSDYSNKTSFGYIVLHSLSEDGGQVSLSSTSNANTSITNEDGVAVSYFTDFSKYFLTASRANGELVSIDENTAPYTTPTIAEPFVPANTINGETYSGTAKDPTANSDVRHDFFTVANTSGGNAGGDLDLAENKYEGNTFVTILLTNAAGNFLAEETITDFEGETATVKSYANTASVVLEVAGVKGTFTEGETLTDTSTTADIFSSLVSNTQVTLTLSGNTFDTAANTDLDLGFSVSNTFSLEASPVRIDDVVTITSPAHGVRAGERIILKGADDEFGEFNDTFVVKEATTNTITFSTSNSVSATPTGNFSLTKHIIFGESSNASAFVNIRTVNASANIVFQSSNLSTGFAIGNTITGSTGGSGTVDRRTLGGTWYQTKTSEVKTYYTTSTSGTWNYDSSNNPLGIESSANVGPFWLNEFKPVKINQIVASSGTGDSYVAPKMVLDIALATSSDTSGGYNDSITSTLPGIYFAYPLKTYEAQVHGTTTTLEKYNNFANVVISPEGLDINYDWKPLGNSSGVATNGTHINTDGSVVTTSYNPEECTTLDKDEFNGHLGPYDDTATANSTYGYPNADDDIFLSAIPSNRSSGKKVGTSGAVYPSVNNNPFFPAVSGTHKPISNTADGFTGTQPGSLTANDIYAGSYTQIDSGGIDPGTVDTPQNYRYIIRNDLKWTYATSPAAAPVGAAVSTGEGQTYNVPRTTAYTASYDGYSKSSDGFGVLIDSVEAQSGAGYGTTAAIPRNSTQSGCQVTTAAGAQGSPPSLTTGNVQGGGTAKFNSSHYASGQASTTFNWNTTTVSGTGHDMVVTTAIVRHVVSAGTSLIYDSGTSGTTTARYTVTATTPSETGYLVNRVGAMMKKANTVTFHTMLASLQTGNDSTYGAGYRDPNEPSSPNLKTDATFDADVNTMSGLLTSANSYHYTVTSGGSPLTNSTFSTGSGATANTYVNTTYNAWLAGIATFQTALKLRITEISNRIGYLNGKGSQTGGIADGGSGTQSSNSGTAGYGFAGTDFNNGKGYANTIYSHCNFLAGKKIKLYQKILAAVEDVDSLYTNIKSKRSEYYEYNQ